MKALATILTLTMALGFGLQAHALFDSLEPELTEGKIQASMINQAMDMRTEAESMIAEIVTIEDMVGTSQEDTGGLLKSLGEKEFFASLAKKQMDEAIQKMTPYGASDKTISENYSLVIKLKKQVETLYQETKQLVK